MKDKVQKALEGLDPVFTAIEEELAAWTSDACLQFPNLLNNLSLKLNWSEEDKRRHDQVVRYYIWKHPDWISVRGAKGGITRRDKVEVKNAAKALQKALKDEFEAKIDASLAANDESEEVSE